MANSASANPGDETVAVDFRVARFVPIMGMIDPILGTSNIAFLEREHPDPQIHHGPDLVVVKRGGAVFGSARGSSRDR